MKIFVDTNVLIDFICNREEFYESAEDVFSRGLVGDIEIYFTDISVVNTLYVGKKYGYTADELNNQLLETLKYCKIVPIDTSTIVDALSSNWKDKEDAIQYYAAESMDADYIVTRNTEDYTLSPIHVILPQDLEQVLD